MARSKSISGTKSSGAKSKPPQAGAPGANELNNVPAPAAEIAPAASVQVSESAKSVRAERGAGANGNSETHVGGEPRKLEVVKPETAKSDGRSNVVPINLDDEIRRRAYELYQQRGDGTGSEADDWLRAEREVRQRYHQHSA